MKQFIAILLLLSFTTPLALASSDLKIQAINSIEQQEKDLAIEEQNVSELLVKLSVAKQNFTAGEVSFALATVLQISRTITKKSPTTQAMYAVTELALTVVGSFKILSSLLDNTETELKLAQQAVINRKQALAELKAELMKLD